MNEIKLTVEQIQAISLANQKAFIETGKYYLTKNEADAQFGGATISALITNKLLKDERPIKEKRHKCRFLLTDIITGIEVLKNL